MGLDMYLCAELYVSGYKHQNKEGQKIFQTLIKLFKADGFYDKECPSAHVKFTIAYWRKANMIHQWFVENCQGGRDECQDARVSREQLIELRGICREIIDDHIKGALLLPTQEGFFFGDTEYDDCYFADIENTHEMLTRILDNIPEDWDFEYHSSW